MEPEYEKKIIERDADGLPTAIIETLADGSMVKKVIERDENNNITSITPEEYTPEIPPKGIMAIAKLAKSIRSIINRREALREKFRRVGQMTLTADKLMSLYNVQDRDACVRYLDSAKNTRFSEEEIIADFRMCEKAGKKIKDLIVKDGLVITASNKSSGLVKGCGDEFDDASIFEIKNNPKNASDKFLKDIRE